MLPFSKIKAFLSKVRNALTAGVRLNEEDRAFVLDLLEKALMREYIYTVAILQILGEKKPSKKTVDRFVEMFSKATGRIVKGKPPFSPREEEVLINLLKENGLTISQAKRLLSAFTAVRSLLLTDGFEHLGKVEKERKEELA